MTASFQMIDFYISQVLLYEAEGWMLTDEMLKHPKVFEMWIYKNIENQLG